jgi:hypothetical protein
MAITHPPTSSAHVANRHNRLRHTVHCSFLQAGDGKPRITSGSRTWDGRQQHSPIRHPCTDLVSGPIRSRLCDRCAPAQSRHCPRTAHIGRPVSASGGRAEAQLKNGQVRRLWMAVHADGHFSLWRLVQRGKGSAHANFLEDCGTGAPVCYQGT